MESFVEILAIISPLAALIFGYFSFNRARKADEHKASEDKVTTIVKLENIGEDTKEIKADIKGIKVDISGIIERLAKVEASVASAHHRIDGLTK
jgi:ribosomal protein L12E/L44/L45/RPP1/RPP2